MMRIIMAKQPALPDAQHALPFAHQPPQLTILADHAAQDRTLEELEKNAVAHTADRDLLALESRLSSTFDILRHRNTRCPLALAVYGDWGTGKTSAMRWLETKLKEWNSSDNKHRGTHPRAYSVWFDPWRYHSREEVWRGIIAEVILGLFSVAQLNRQNFLPRMVGAAKKFGGFLGRSFLHALANLEVTVGGKAKVPGLAEGEASISASGEMFREIWDEYQKTSQPQKAYLNQFEQTLRDFVKDFLQELTLGDAAPPRLVIFIDDLDRCLPAVALEVLEALKLYLSIPQLIFVVGLDQAVVNAVVAKHYQDQGVAPEKAASYLHKLFQLELRIPPSEAQMSDYMKQQIEALNQATGGYWEETLRLTDCGPILDSALIRAARNNPREVKRLLNSALIYGRNAALDLELKKEDQDNKAPALRFAQGVQVLLLQRVLGEDLVNNKQVLAIGRHLEWMEGFSKHLREFVGISQWNLEMISSCLVNSKGVDPDSLAKWVHDADRESMRRAIAPQGIVESFLRFTAHIHGATPDPDCKAWLQVPFLELMQVPFSQAVAQCAPVLAAGSKPAAPFNLSKLPALMRERLALAAQVPTEQLAPGHLPQIADLDLSGIHLTAADLRVLPPLEGLRSVDLRNCVTLESTQPLAGLTQLQTLNLEGCTGLQGPAALQGLAGLKELTVLYLSGCTGLESMAPLAGLEKLQRLWLNRCTGLKGAAAFQNLAGLEELTVLDLRYCTGLDEAAVRVVRRMIRRECTMLGPDAEVVWP